ncbi:MAG: hypothetical protein VX092_03430, partial [SAR324 cluster bacterium]|nr:hypothetical protein [SAR324 cluster bacterium]
MKADGSNRSKHQQPSATFFTPTLFFSFRLHYAGNSDFSNYLREFESIMPVANQLRESMKRSSWIR